MKLNRSIVSLTLVVIVALPGLARADKHRREHRVPVRREVVVVHRRPLYRLRVAPPAVRTEVRVVAPSPRHVWIPGYWGWRHGRHLWIGGLWRLPPAPGRIWIEPRWLNEGGAWVFYDGYWSTGPAPEAPPPPVQEQEWEVDVPPPAAQIEQPPPAPTAQHFWVPGYWSWDGRRHVWAPGRWELRRTGYQFEPGHWEARGGRWHWQPGSWRHE